MNIQHVIDLLNRAELYEESSIVLEIVQQNKDMLEALKGMKDAFCNPENGEIDKRLAVQDMNIAITRAEATE